MLYYNDYESEMSCKFCGHLRFKPIKSGKEKFKQISYKKIWYLPLIPRLQRIYASTVTTASMRWHHESQRELGVLSHPSDGEIWKHFDQKYLNFFTDPRNVRLGVTPHKYYDF